jgi:hypothetical protein
MIREVFQSASALITAWKHSPLKAPNRANIGGFSSRVSRAGVLCFHQARSEARIDQTINLSNNNPNNMRLFKSKFLCSLCLAFGIALLLSSGCATTKTESLFTVSGPGWHIQQGQALWTPKTGAPQFGGDLVVATDANGQSLVQFDKTPLTIVAVQTTSTQWLLRFPNGGGLWKGHEPAPTRTIWLHLADALAGKPLPKPLHFEQKPDGNWRLENIKTGEILEGFLSS